MNKSFIEVNQESHFPIQNLPYGVFSTKDNNTPRIGVAIGDYVLDLAVLEKEGFFKNIIDEDTTIFNRPYLNDFMSLGNEIWSQVRKRFSFYCRQMNRN